MDGLQAAERKKSCHAILQCALMLISAERLKRQSSYCLFFLSINLLSLAVSLPCSRSFLKSHSMMILLAERITWGISVTMGFIKEKQFVQKFGHFHLIRDMQCEFRVLSTIFVMQTLTKIIVFLWPRVFRLQMTWLYRET